MKRKANMKRSVAISLAVLFAAIAPANAKSVKHKQGGLYPHASQVPSGGYGSGTNRFPNVYNYGGIQGTGPLYRGGRYLGQDPDPNVRAQILRDQNRSRR
jgi:hypothetical protein